MRLSFSAKELDKTVEFSIQDAEENSVKAELTAFPDVISDLLSALNPFCGNRTAVLSKYLPVHFQIFLHCNFSGSLVCPILILKR